MNLGENMSCQDCGHRAGGRFPSPTMNKLRAVVGLRMVRPKCATYELGAFYDPEYFCGCTNMAHAMEEAQGRGWEAAPALS